MKSRWMRLTVCVFSMYSCRSFPVALIVGYPPVIIQNNAIVSQQVIVAPAVYGPTLAEQLGWNLGYSIGLLIGYQAQKRNQCKAQEAYESTLKSLGFSFQAINGLAFIDPQMEDAVLENYQKMVNQLSDQNSKNQKRTNKLKKGWDTFRGKVKNGFKKIFSRKSKNAHVQRTSL